MDKVTIVGIAGYPRSGKDSLGEAFVHAGFYGVSFGEIVRAYARKRHTDKPNPISLENMTETSNWLREQNGADVLLQEALRQYREKTAAGEQYKGLLFISVRAPIEADFIHKHNGHLIWVEASNQVRYARNNANLRDGESKLSLEEFIRQEQLQAKPQPGIDASIQMDMEYVRSQATHTFDNNQNDLELFLQQAKQLADKIISS